MNSLNTYTQHVFSNFGIWAPNRIVHWCMVVKTQENTLSAASYRNNDNLKLLHFINYNICDVFSQTCRSLECKKLVPEYFVLCGPLIWFSFATINCYEKSPPEQFPKTHLPLWPVAFWTEYNGEIFFLIHIQ